MALSKKQYKEIKDYLSSKILEKLGSYNPETESMPFHYRLLGKDRYAIFSFIQSMNTTFGISVWEQIAVILAKNSGRKAFRQYKLLGEIDDNTEKFIRNTHIKLRNSEIPPDKIDIIEKIRKKIKKGEAKTDPDSVVDLFLSIDDEENYFDITSAKPNMKEFVALKLKLLRWTALRLSQNKKSKVFTRLAIPYNPYRPKSYNRWTLKGLYDLENGEILVGEEFWNFVAGDDIYEELLYIFQEVGEELKDKINKKFAEFRGKT